MKKSSKILALTLIGLVAAAVGIICFGPIGAFFAVATVGIARAVIIPLADKGSVKKEAPLDEPNFDEASNEDKKNISLNAEKDIRQSFKNDPFRPNFADINLENDNINEESELTR